MKKFWLLLKTYDEICYLSCICTCLMFFIDSFFLLDWNGIFLITAPLLTQLLIHKAVQKKMVFHLISTTAFVHLIVYLYILIAKKEMAPFALYLRFIIPCIVFSLLCYLSGKNFLLKSLLIIPQLPLLIYFSIAYIPMEKWCVWLVLFCQLFYLCEYTEQKYDKSFSNNILYLFPVLILSTMILLLLPIHEKPISWKNVKKAAVLLEEAFHSAFVNLEYLFEGSQDSYSLAETGFSGKGTLGGDIILTDKPQLIITGTKTKGQLYLIGSIYNEYTGTNWENNLPAKPYHGKEYLLQEKEISYALSQSIYTMQEISELENLCMYDVTFKGLKTKSLFYPPFVTNVFFPEYTNTNDSIYDTIVLEKAKGVGFTYGFHNKEFNYEHENFIRLLQQKSWKSSFAPNPELSARHNYIYENYTYLPNTIPSRVYSLAQEITANDETAYDKLISIQTFLQQYPYSTTPKTASKESDFIDYFLFEGKSGYCTYFATAMSVLARCVGIPTRFVEGFVTQNTDKYSNKDILITGASAHAWPEAYIDDIGWIPFEPTPGFANSKIWENTAESKKIIETAPIVPPIPSTTEKYEASAEEIKVPNEKPYAKTIYMAIGIITCIILMTCMIIFIRNLVCRKLYQSGSGYEKMLLLMKKVLRLGKLYGYEKEESETLTSYEIRINHCLDTLSINFSDICIHYMAIRFGDNNVPNEALALLELYTDTLEKQYRNQCTIPKKLLYMITG